MHNLTASWDPALISKVGQAIGEDSLALGIDIVLGPGMNIQKNVLCGRNFEYCSEDPILTGIMSTAYVNGMQSSGAGACLKHYAANNQETARGSTSANVTERALREIYLKGFGIAIRDSSPWVVMSSYNRINRNHNATERELLVNILRDEFGFVGMVTSDWGGVTGSIDNKIKAMNDLNMPGNPDDPAILMAAVNSGTVSMEALDTCCRNILSVVAKTRTAKGEKKEGVDYEAHAELARQAAEESFVLLKNDAALPLNKGATVALFGNGSFATVYGGGGSGVVHSKTNISIFDGIKASGSLILYDESGSPFRGCEAHDVNDPSKDVEVTVSYAERCAKEADTAVIVLSRQAIEGVDSSNRLGDFRFLLIIKPRSCACLLYAVNFRFNMEQYRKKSDRLAIFIINQKDSVFPLCLGYLRELFRKQFPGPRTNRSLHRLIFIIRVTESVRHTVRISILFRHVTDMRILRRKLCLYRFRGRGRSGRRHRCRSALRCHGYSRIFSLTAATRHHTTQHGQTTNAY